MRASFFFFLIISTALYATPPIKDVYDLSKVFLTTDPESSLFNAALLVETGYLKELIKHPKKTSNPTYVFATELFKIKSGQVYCENNNSKASAHLNPAIVAGLLLAKKNNDLGDKQWKQALKKDLNTQLKSVSKGKMTATKTEEFVKTFSCVPEKDSAMLLACYSYLRAQKKNDVVEYYNELKKNKLANDIQASENAQPVHNFLYELFIKRNYRSPLPPRVKERDILFKEKCLVHDCTEAVLRDFFDFILYNPTTHHFDLGQLPKKINQSKELKLFYEKYNKPEMVNSNPNIAHEWMNLLANRSGIIYKHIGEENFVVRPFLCNIVQIMNQLLGTTKQTFDELCALLSTNKRTISCVYEKREDESLLHFTFKGAEFHKPYTITIHSLELHGSIERDSIISSQQKDNKDEKVIQSIVKKIESNTQNYQDITQLAVLLPQDTSYLKQLLKQINTKRISSDSLCMLYKLMDTDFDEIDHVVVEDLCNRVKDFSELESLLLQFLNEQLDDIDHYHYIKHIVKNNLHTKEAFLNKIIDYAMEMENKELIRKTIEQLNEFSWSAANGKTIGALINVILMPKQ